MAENKYRVSGSAYGYGNLFGSDKNGFDDDFMSQYVTNDNASYSQGMTTSPTSAPAPVPATPQVNQLEMGSGSDPRGNANDISNKAITGQTSVGMYGGGAPGTEFDDPFGTGSMQSFQDARNAPRGYDAYEQAMDQAGEDMRLRGITSETYSATPLPSSSQNREFISGYGGGSAMGQADYDAAYGEGTRLDNNVAMRSVSTPSVELPDVNPVNEVTDTYRGMVASSVDELIDEYRPGIVDDRFIEELARNNIGAQAFSEGGSDLALESLQGSGAESLSLDAMNRDAMMNVSEVAVPDRMLSLGQKLSEGFKKFDAVGEKIAKAAPAIQALTTIATGLQEQQQRGKVIQGLRGSVNTLSSSIGNLANEEAATEDAMFDEFTEENRRIGARRNLQLGSKLDSVRGSNINTGTVKRIKKEITDDMSTMTDLDLAKAADSYEDRKGRYTEQSRADRSKMNEQLKQLQAQLAEEEKASRMAPFSMIADVGIAAVSAANPLAGMALSAVKNKAMG